MKLNLKKTDMKEVNGGTGPRLKRTRGPVRMVRFTLDGKGNDVVKSLLTGNTWGIILCGDDGEEIMRHSFLQDLGYTWR